MRLIFLISLSCCRLTRTPPPCLVAPGIRPGSDKFARHTVCYTKILFVTISNSKIFSPFVVFHVRDEIVRSQRLTRPTRAAVQRAVPLRAPGVSGTEFAPIREPIPTPHSRSKRCFGPLVSPAVFAVSHRLVAYDAITFDRMRVKWQTPTRGRHEDGRRAGGPGQSRPRRTPGRGDGTRRIRCMGGSGAGRRRRRRDPNKWPPRTGRTRARGAGRRRELQTPELLGW